MGRNALIRRKQPTLKEQRKKKKLWKLCPHRFAPHFEFDAASGGFWYTGEICKRCKILLPFIPLEEEAEDA